MKLKYFCICSKLRTLCLLRLIKEKVNIVDFKIKSTTITKNISLFPVYSDDPKVFDWGPFNESNYNLAAIKISNSEYLYLYNIITPDLKLLSKEWFRNCYLHRDYVRVKRRDDGCWNFLGLDGKLLSQEWYDDCSDFYKGFAKVMKFKNGSEEFNFIRKDGKLLSKEWFYWSDYFFRGDYVEVITKQGDRRWIDMNGNFYSEKPV